MLAPALGIFAKAVYTRAAAAAAAGNAGYAGASTCNGTCNASAAPISESEAEEELQDLLAKGQVCGMFAASAFCVCVCVTYSTYNFFAPNIHLASLPCYVRRCGECLGQCACSSCFRIVL